MNSTEASISDPVAKYVRYVEKIDEYCRTDPGRRAQLRRGLRQTPERAVTMHAVVAPWLPDGVDAAKERAY